MLQGHGKFQVTGGNGTYYPYSNTAYIGGGGSGGRIAMYFNSNKTFAGSWDIYGGSATDDNGDGSSGTAFFYHNSMCFAFSGCH